MDDRWSRLIDGLGNKLLDLFILGLFLIMFVGILVAFAQAIWSLSLNG
jgi:hypothetical protein